MSSLLRAHGPKNNSRKTGWAADRVTTRRTEALARQAAYDLLSVDQKIAKLDAGGFAAVKQRNRLAYSKILSEVKKRST